MNVKTASPWIIALSLVLAGAASSRGEVVRDGDPSGGVGGGTLSWMFGGSEDAPPETAKGGERGLSWSVLPEDRKDLTGDRRGTLQWVVASEAGKEVEPRTEGGSLRVESEEEGGAPVETSQTALEVALIVESAQAEPSMAGSTDGGTSPLSDEIMEIIVAGLTDSAGANESLTGGEVEDEARVGRDSYKIQDYDPIASGGEMTARPGDAGEIQNENPSVEGEGGVTEVAEEVEVAEDAEVVEDAEAVTDSRAIDSPDLAPVPESGRAIDQVSPDEGSGDEEGAFVIDLKEGAETSIVDRFIEMLRHDPAMEEAEREIRLSCGDFSLEHYLSEDDGNGKEPSVFRFWGGDKTLVFAVILTENQVQREKGGGVGWTVGKCGWGGGIVPGAQRALRAALTQRVGEANSALARGGLLDMAERLAGLEIQSLTAALDFEEGRLEAGVGKGSRVATLRTRMGEANADFAWVRREGRMARDRFESLTGIPFQDSWGAQSEDPMLKMLHPDTDSDADFGAMFSLVAGIVKTNEEGAGLLQDIAGEVVAGTSRVGRQRVVSELAAEGLRKTRGDFDLGGSDEGEEAESRALLLRVQREEISALAGMMEAEAMAYAPVRVEVLPAAVADGGSEGDGGGVEPFPSWIVAAIAVAVLGILLLTVASTVPKTGKSGGGSS